MQKYRVKYKNTLGIDSIKAEADDYARQARELDDLIQYTNWLVDLVD